VVCGRPRHLGAIVLDVGHPVAVRIGHRHLGGLRFGCSRISTLTAPHCCDPLTAARAARCARATCSPALPPFPCESSTSAKTQVCLGSGEIAGRALVGPLLARDRHVVLDGAHPLPYSATGGAGADREDRDEEDPPHPTGPRRRCGRLRGGWGRVSVAGDAGVAVPRLRCSPARSTASRANRRLCFARSAAAPYWARPCCSRAFVR